MPLYHVLECDKCGVKSELQILQEDDGAPALGGGHIYCCDASWQTVPDGWYVLDRRFPARAEIYCPACRGKFNPEKILEAVETRRLAEKLKRELAQEQKRENHLKELAKPTGPPLTDDPTARVPL